MNDSNRRGADAVDVDGGNHADGAPWSPPPRPAAGTLRTSLSPSHDEGMHTLAAAAAVVQGNKDVAPPAAPQLL